MLLRIHLLLHTHISNPHTIYAHMYRRERLHAENGRFLLRIRSYDVHACMALNRALKFSQLMHADVLIIIFKRGFDWGLITIRIVYVH